MSGVPQIELRQCTGLEKGKPPAQQPYYGDGAAFYLTPEYLRGAATACNSVKPSTNAVRVDSSDTILLWDGSNAGEVLRGRPGILASTMSRVAHDARFLSPYFFYSLKRWEAYLKSQTSGSGIPHVDKEILGRLKIAEFEKPEQSKIAEVLATVDRAIEQTKSLIAKQQRIKIGLMQDLLTRGIDEHGNLRSGATHKFKDSPLGWIPVEWDVGGLEHYVVQEAGIKPGPFGSSLTKEMYADGGYRVYGQEQVIGGSLDIGDYFITRRKYREMIGFAIQEGDVLISLVGTIGHVLVVPLDFHPGIINPRLLRFRPARDRCVSAFLKQLFLSALIRMQLDVLATGGTMPVLSGRIIHSLKVPLIPLPEQNVIAASSADAAQTAESHLRQLIKLRRIKTGLMQDLLTGKRRVTSLLKSAPEEAAS